MDAARYFVPDHPTLTEVYTRDELRIFLQKGELSRSDMVCDDETGLAHLLGDFLSMPYREATLAPSRRTESSTAKDSKAPDNVEFRGDVPLKPQGNRFKHAPPHASDEEDTIYRPGSEDDADSFGEGLTPYPDHERDDDDEQDDLRSFYSPLSSSGIPQFITDAEQESATHGQPAYFEHSGDPEEMLYMGHPSWLSFPKALSGFVLFAGMAVYVWQAAWGLEWLLLLCSVAGLFLIYITLERTTTSYFVTPYRVEMEFGLIGRNTKEVRIRDIRAIDVQQKGWLALLGVGTVHFDSSATSGPEVMFRNVRKPHQVKELVRSLQHSR